MKFSKKNFFLITFFAFSILAVQSQELEELFKQKQYDSVIVKLQKKERSLTLLTKDYFLLSKSYSKIKKQHHSLVILNKIIPKLNIAEDHRNLAIAYNLKAENLVDLSKIDEGVKFCDKALTDIEKNKAPFLQELCIKCGVLFDEGGYYQKAYTTYQKITKKELKESTFYINNYAVILMNLQQYDQALYYLKKGIKIDTDKNQLTYINTSYGNVAKILIRKKQWAEAKKYLDSAYRSLNKTDRILDKKTLLKTSYNFYTLQGKFETAKNVLYHIEDHNNLIYDYEIQQKIKELSAINERKNILTKKVATIDQEIRTTNKTKLKWFIILISLIIIMTSWVLLIIYKNTRLKYQKVLNEQELLSSQMTPHFIFNSLSILQGMVLNSEHQKASVYLSKFSNILKFIVQEQSNTFIPINEEIIGLKDYVDLQNLSTKKNMNFIVTIEKTLENQLLIPPMILQPFIENAIIHGFKYEVDNPIISIAFTLKQKVLQCSIKDNGVGISSNLPINEKSKNKSSLAIKIVKDRFNILSQKMNRTFSVSIENLKTNGEQGTEVLLELPYILQK